MPKTLTEEERQKLEEQLQNLLPTLADYTNKANTMLNIVKERYGIVPREGKEAISRLSQLTQAIPASSAAFVAGLMRDPRYLQELQQEGYVKSTGIPGLDVAIEKAGAFLGPTARYVGEAALAQQALGPVLAALGRIPQLARIAELTPSVVRAVRA